MTDHVSLINTRRFVEDHRAELQEAVHRIVASDPDFPETPFLSGNLDIYLQPLVEIACCTSGPVKEAYLYQMMEYVCIHCPMQDQSGYCGLRKLHCGLCRHAMEVVQAVAAVVRRHVDASNRILASSNG